MDVELVAIGNEVLSGSIVNSNSAFLSQELLKLGFTVTRHTVLPDELSALKQGLEDALKRSTLVITTGGLGPTCDDVSRQAAAELFNSEFFIDQDITADLKRRFGNISSLEDQSTIPRNAKTLKNSVGTAPGLIFQQDSSTLIMLPGVPTEMKAMFTDGVTPFLNTIFPISSRFFVKHLYMFNTPESAIDPFLRSLKKQHPAVEFGIYPSHGYVGVTLSTRAKNNQDAETQLDPPYQVLAKQFAAVTFESSLGKVEDAVQKRFVQKKLTLSAAESCTGGQFAATITQQPGASQFFLGSIVAYSNSLKTQLLGISPQLIQDHGAVSKEVVTQMLKGLFEKTQSDYGVAVSGVAGPSGGTPDKPVGTVWCAAGKRGGIPHVWKPFTYGNRQTIIMCSVTALLAELLILTGIMNYPEALKKMQSIDQAEVLGKWTTLSNTEQSQLLKQIESLDLATFHLQQELLKQKYKQVFDSLDPFTEYSQSGNTQDSQSGKKLISQGKVGCILIAGGQGTRLRFPGPKGFFPITPIKNKSLFQFFAEKVIAAGHQVNRLLPLAIMTSPLNDAVIRQFFSDHNNFGLKQEQLFFFCQKMLPFLDENGNLIMENQGRIAEGPDGNGFSLKYFVEAGLWEHWQQKGIRYVNYVLIDNALADPYDAELIGFHHRQQADVTVKCTLRKDTKESVGLLTKHQGHVQVTEYSEMPETERVACQPDGTLKHQCANLSLYCFNMSFIKDVSQQKLPLHLAFKAINGSEKKAWKFEAFIFDVLPFAKGVSALLYPREKCFAPLKNFEGNDSPQTVQKALQEEAKRIIKEITGLPPPSAPFELAPEFYYPTEQLLQHWKGRHININSSYIPSQN